MIVYGSILSPFTRKVLAFAREKGIRLELKPAGPGQGGAEFAETSPFGKIPGFRDPGADGAGDFVLSDSSAIVAYLEAKFPMPGLIPLDPQNRARAIWFDEFADTVVIPETGPIFVDRFLLPAILHRDGDEAAASRAEREGLPRVLDYLERAISPAGFLIEDRLTLADISVASAMLNPMLLGARIDRTRWPRAGAYLDAMLGRRSFAWMVEEAAALIAAFAPAPARRLRRAG